MQPIPDLQLLVLLLLANGTPVLAKKIFGQACGSPVDGGRAFVDGRPLFGPSKTVRGIVLSVLATAVAAPLLGRAWEAGATAGAAAMAGDLLSSFIKRRLRMPPSSMALGIDQIPECLLPALICRYWLPLSAADIAAVVLIFLAGELILSRIAYRLHLRDQPY